MTEGVGVDVGIMGMMLVMMVWAGRHEAKRASEGKYGRRRMEGSREAAEKSKEKRQVKGMEGQEAKDGKRDDRRRVEKEEEEEYELMMISIIQHKKVGI